MKRFPWHKVPAPILRMVGFGIVFVVALKLQVYVLLLILFGDRVADEFLRRIPWPKPYDPEEAA